MPHRGGLARMRKAPRRKRRSARPPTLEAASAATLALADEAQQQFMARKPVSRRPAEMPGPVRFALAAPAFGDAAKLAAALILLRRAEQQGREVGDRRLVIAARIQSGTLIHAEARDAVAHVEAELEAIGERITAARA